MSRPLSQARWPLAIAIASAVVTLLSAAPALADPTKPKPPETGALPNAAWNYPTEEKFDNAMLARLKVPAGWHVNVFAKDAGHARMLLPVGRGRVLLSRPKTNDVVLLSDADGDGSADAVRTVASGLGRVHGLARDGDTVFLAGERMVWKATLNGDGSLGEPVMIAELPVGAQHPNRTVGVGRDGWLYVSVGSTCNDCTESDPEHATMLRMKPDGSERGIYSRGLRNTIGFGWHPATGALWGMDHGTDWRGDDIPPEELNMLVQDGHYGWPTCWAKQQVDDSRPDPEGTTKAQFCAKDTKPSILEAPAHSAPIGMTFATRGPFDGDAFVAMRGSWNRSAPRAPRIVRVDFDGRGMPTGQSDFVSGFLSDDGTRWFGRLAGVALADGGSLLFTDDMNGVVYRVAQRAARADAPPMPDAMDALKRIAHVDGFDVPESVLHDTQQDLYFVSNMGKSSFKKDNNGFISKLAPDGTVQAMKFIAGAQDGVTLHSPKGLAINGDLLWVTDLDHLRAFDRTTGKHVRSIAVPGSKFLNDLVVGPDGTVYASDTGLTANAQDVPMHTGPNRIVAIAPDGRSARVLLEDKALHGPNGLWWDVSRNALVIAQMKGRDLLTWTPGGEVPKTLVTGVGTWDGLTWSDTLLASSGKDSVIYMLRDSRMVPLKAAPPAPGDIGFDMQRNRLLIPSLKGNWVEMWELPKPRTALPATAAR